MRSLDEAQNQFAYHPATPETAPKFAEIRDKAKAFLVDVWPLIPDGPEKTLAVRHLQQFQMFANLAVALTAPADLTNHAVARVMPNKVVSCGCKAIRVEVDAASVADPVVADDVEHRFDGELCTPLA